MNRFLWASPLNALQFVMVTVDEVQITALKTSQSYTITEPVKPSTNSVGAVSRGKPGTSREKVSFTLDGRDTSKEAKDPSKRSTDGVFKLQEAINNHPYFKTNLVKSQAQLADAMNKLKVVEDSMASGVDHYTWAIKLLEEARARHDVKIIETTRPVKGDVGLLPQFPYQAAIFTVRGAGHYHDFGKFLADFENSFPYFRVQNLSLSVASDSVVGPETPTAATGVENLSF